jgi:AAA+ ATPase superfamily predicted ATPase
MPYFKDRSRELTILEEQLKKEGPQLFVLYGQRRIGKTELIKRFISRKAAFYFCASPASDPDLLNRLKLAMERMYLTTLNRRLPSVTWESLITFMLENLTRRANILILDEYPLLQGANGQFTQLLARIWEEKAKGKNIMLILSGSDAAVLKDGILDGTSPLSPHVTDSLQLMPLTFSSSRAFLPQYSGAEQMLCYSALGGVPANLSKFDPRKPLEQNFKTALLNKDSYLYREPLMHLWEEMREPGQYFSLLHAVSLGHSRLPEICRQAGMKDIYATNKYLFALRERRLLVRITPFTEADPQKSRKGRYTFANPFFRFWFRFVFSNRTALELGDEDTVWREGVKPNLTKFCRSSFIDVCLQRLERLSRYGNLPFEVRKMGRWWNKTDSIDLVVEGRDGSVLLCLCDWSEKRLGSDGLQRLNKKARWFADAPRIFFGLFSGQGFSKELKMKAAERSDVLLLPYY